MARCRRSAGARPRDASALAVQRWSCCAHASPSCAWSRFDSRSRGRERSELGRASERGPHASPRRRKPSAADRARARRRRGAGPGSGSAGASPCCSTRAAWRRGCSPWVSCVVSPGEPRPGDVPLALDLPAQRRGLRYQPGVSADQGGAEVAAGVRRAERGAALPPPRCRSSPGSAWRGGVYTVGVARQRHAPLPGPRERAWSALGALSLGLRSRPWAHLSLGRRGRLLWRPHAHRCASMSIKVAMAGGTHVARCARELSGGVLMRLVRLSAVLLLWALAATRWTRSRSSRCSERPEQARVAGAAGPTSTARPTPTLAAGASRRTAGANGHACWCSTSTTSRTLQQVRRVAERQIGGAGGGLALPRLQGQPPSLPAIPARACDLILNPTKPPPSGWCTLQLARAAERGRPVRPAAAVLAMLRWRLAQRDEDEWRWGCGAVRCAGITTSSGRGGRAGS
jgi:hypothetical protein